MFVPDKVFQSSKKFSGNARSLPIDCGTICGSNQTGCGLATKIMKSLKKLAMNKHYSLFLVIVIMVDVTYGIAKYARVIVPGKAFKVF